MTPDVVHNSIDTPLGNLLVLNTYYYNNGKLILGQKKYILGKTIITETEAQKILSDMNFKEKVEGVIKDE